MALRFLFFIKYSLFMWYTIHTSYSSKILKIWKFNVNINKHVELESLKISVYDSSYQKKLKILTIRTYSSYLQNITIDVVAFRTEMFYHFLSTLFIVKNNTLAKHSKAYCEQFVNKFISYLRTPVFKFFLRGVKNTVHHKVVFLTKENDFDAILLLYPTHFDF